MKLVCCKLREQITKTGQNKNSKEYTSHGQGYFHDLKSLLRKSCFHRKTQKFCIQMESLYQLQI